VKQTVGGSFKYNLATGKILSAGTQTLSAAFTPSSTTDYKTVTATASLQVNPDSTITTVTSNDQTVTNFGRTGTATATIDFNVTTAYKPTESVTVTASTGENCAGTVSMMTGNGTCKLTFSTTGLRTVNASYAGDTNPTGSNSDSQNPQITVTVNQ